MMQTVVVVAIVLAATLFVVRRAWMTVRRAKRSTGACGDCGCGTSR